MTLQQKYKKYNINLPSSDLDAYIRYPKYSHLYDRMWVTLSQEIICAPLGVMPNKYPIVVKPIINLYGMSKGFSIIKNEKEYKKVCKTQVGLFWQPYFSGLQKNVDLIMYEGEIRFHNILESYTDKHRPGAFIYHKRCECQTLDINLKKWIKENLENYTGALNLEVIKGHITECHLRLNGDNFWYKDDFYKKLKNLRNFPDDIELEDIIIVPIFCCNNEKLIDSFQMKEIRDTSNEPQGEYKRYKICKIENDNLQKYISYINGIKQQ
jgi:hypothetical protein